MVGMMSIPITNCSGVCQTQRLFNTTASSTYKQAKGVHWDIYPSAGLSSWGSTAVDTVSVGPWSIEEFQCVSMTHVEPLKLDAWRNYVLWDVVVGLAPLDVEKPQAGFSVSWLSGLVLAGALKRNLFTLRSKGLHAWELGYGEIDPGLGSWAFSTYPLAPEAIEQEKWLFNSTGIASLIIGDRDLSMDISSIQYSTVESGISLPPVVAEYIQTAVSIGPGGLVDCYSIHKFPVLRLDLGGQMLDLKGEDYTIRSQYHWGDSCFLVIAAGKVEHIVLGSVTLKRFYSVWDLDQKAVHLAREG